MLPIQSVTGQDLSSNIEFILCWLSTAGHGAASKCALYVGETPLGKTSLSFAGV